MAGPKEKKTVENGRLRVEESCDRCKRRKEKCDHAKPCQRCIKAGIECHWTGNPKLIQPVAPDVPHGNMGYAIPQAAAPYVPNGYTNPDGSVGMGAPFSYVQYGNGFQVQEHPFQSEHMVYGQGNGGASSGMGLANPENAWSTSAQLPGQARQWLPYSDGMMHLSDIECQTRQPAGQTQDHTFTDELEVPDWLEWDGDSSIVVEEEPEHPDLFQWDGNSNIVVEEEPDHPGLPQMDADDFALFLSLQNYVPGSDNSSF